jgi:hypothetical protein
MKQRVGKISSNIDIARLKLETKSLIERNNWDIWKLQQVSLQTNGDDDWNASIGSRPDQLEQQWNIIHPQLAGTWWEDFFKSLPMPVYRSRLMIMHPRTCYSIHSDLNPRLHIAITTTKQARFIFTDPPQIIHLPDNGTLWWVDTREEHTAINGSMGHRIHLVMCLANNDTDH